MHEPFFQATSSGKTLKSLSRLLPPDQLITRESWFNEFFNKLRFYLESRGERLCEKYFQFSQEAALQLIIVILFTHPLITSRIQVR
jgi:hypothetical protein